MSSRFLPVFVSNASYVLTRSVQVLQARTAKLDRVLDFCTQYRRRGLATFLQNANQTALHQDLQRSGAAFAAYVQWADADSKPASKCSPFYDAVTCGDKVSATAIAHHSSTVLHPDDEYEDDFLYMRILMGRFYLSQDTAALEAMLTRYEMLLDGADDPRYLICCALVRNQADVFDAALHTLLDVREQDYAAGIEADEILEEDWATEGKLFVEGMALVQLARELKFPLQKEYLFIPSIAMQPSAIAFGKDSWTQP